MVDILFQIPTPTKWINQDGSPTTAFFKFIFNLYNSGFGGGIPANTIASNLQATQASPVGNTISEVLDELLGDTQGDIAVRAAALWQVLALGADGEVLASDGTDLVYQLVDKLAATVTMAAGATITTVSGDLKLDSFTHIIQLGTTSVAAAVPANFSAVRTLAIKDASGTTYYIPLNTAVW